jgi:membrane dipeptidase
MFHEVLTSEDKEVKQLHLQALVIDSLFVNGVRCLPGEPQPWLDKLSHEGKDIDDIHDQVRSLCDSQWLSDKFDHWEWWEKSGVDVIHTTIGVSEGVSGWEAYHKAIRDIARWTMRFDKSDKLVKVTEAEDIVRAKREGKYGVILGIQNLNWLNGDLSNIDLLYKFGVRIMQLTYNLRNQVGNGCTERRDDGLSEFGIQAIRKLNELGILIDLSHCGTRTTLEAIEASKSPVAFTHTFCRTVYDHVRGKTDEELKALRDNGGYMGILLVPDFITDKEKPSLDDFVDHVDHAVEVLGADKVGIGTDHGHYYPESLKKSNRDKMAREIEEQGISKVGWRRGHFRDEIVEVEGYRDWRDFSNITRKLKERGYSEKEIQGILGENFLRVFGQVVG